MALVCSCSAIGLAGRNSSCEVGCLSVEIEEVGGGVDGVVDERIAAGVLEDEHVERVWWV